MRLIHRHADKDKIKGEQYSLGGLCVTFSVA